MKFRLLLVLAVAVEVFFTLSCGSNNSTAATSGTGLLYLAAQGNSTLTGYGITLGSGGLTGINEVSTGTNPVAIAITPAVDALFLTSTSSNFVTSYSISSDGSLTVGSNTKTGSTPQGLTVDPSGKFLFVANQASSNISVYTISGTALTPVANSPFTTIAPGTITPTGPVSVAVPPVGNYLYVANQFTNSVSVFSYDSTSGALAPAPGSPYTVGTAPSAVAVSPNGAFLLVSNSGSSNVGSYAICVTVSATCATPDGSVSQVSGSPFSAGLGPSAIAFDPGFNFVYVVDQQSNQVSQYSFGTGSGVLTPLSPSAVSTGTTPVSIAIRSGAVSTDIGNPTLNLTDYAYVANIGGTSLSIYTLTTGSGQLTVLGAPFTTNGQPSAVAAR
jgi:6-phosphogluconolactonase (cycloisomerase 2 family)